MGKCVKSCSNCDNWTDRNSSTGYGTCKKKSGCRMIGRMLEICEGSDFDAAV